MARNVLLLASIVLELALAGCLPVASTSPLGTTVGGGSDPRLTGIWKGKLGTSAGAAYVAFYPGHDGVDKIVVLAPPSADDEGGWIVAEAHVARLGGNTYLDAREMDEDGRTPDRVLAHIPILYEFGADGLLTLYLVDEGAARLAIGKGAVAGSIQPGEFGDVTITAPPTALDGFFASKAGRALFTKPLGILHRAN